jgi:O-succinylbenzoic acid--CoA ligase
VEAALSEHPAVLEVGVVGVPDAEWGARVVAVVVLRAPLSLQDARAWVAERVSPVAAPRELRVVDALPVLPGGKLDRRQLGSGPT